MKLNPTHHLFFPYLLFGYPTMDDFSILFEHAQNHADLIEIGIPFSDPIADGPVIQTAVSKVLSSGIGIDTVFRFLSQHKKRTRIAVMSYANPIWSYGLNQFMKHCREFNVDAAIIPDVPFEESYNWRTAAKENSVSWITFVSLQTSELRLRRMLEDATGFIYLLALTGVTGSQISSVDEVINKARLIRKYSSLPIAAGFGIKHLSDTLKYGNEVDAFIVGSRLIELIQQQDTNAAKAFLTEFASQLKTNTKE